jgi:hypothetical protein
MEEIVDSIKRVTDIMGEISDATREQTLGIEQINEAIGQMDQTTQQNASLVEEAAAASETMQQQAARLAEAVRVFRLGETAPAQAAGPVRSSYASAVKRAPAVRAPMAATRLTREPAALAASGDGWESF